MKVLIIGGVAAGTKTAAKIKRIDNDADVLIITKGMDISYAGCGLPYYVGHVIADKSGLIVNTPEKFKGLTGADVLVGREAYKLDSKAKKVYAKNINTGAEEVYDYDKCVISTGASSIIPKMPGVELPGVFPMRTPDDATGLREYIVNSNAKKAVVAGGGFIGLEVAQNLKEQGIDVTVIDLADQIISNFDPEIAEYCTRILKRNGIKVLVSTKMESITGTDKAEGVMTDKGLLKADIVVLSLGIRANTAFLKDTGIEMMPNGTIKIDDQMKTSIPDVYAAGDCVTTRNYETGNPQWAPMGSAANMEGRVLAQVICGMDKHYKGVLGTAIVKLPEINAGRTGLGEKAAKDLGYDVITALTVTDDKAHYYPGSAFVSIKLIADRNTHKFLGLQAVGPGEVDKMVDIAVMAISMGATLENMEDLDLAYAPPFSTAIHPVVTAVNVLLNKINGVMVSMTPAEYAAGAAKGYKVVDAQNEPTIKGALHVVVSKTNGPVEGLDKDDKILLVCKRARLAYLLHLRLKNFGYTNTVVLEGASFFNDVVVDGYCPRLSQDEITRVKALGFLNNRGTNNFNCRVITRNGKITAAESQCIAEASEKFGSGEITMTSRQTIEIQGVPYEKIDGVREFLSQGGLETGGTGSKVRPVVSCKGTTCQYGLIDTFALSEKVHEMFYHGYSSVKLPHKFKIAVGGCPNNCVKPNLNDIGIIGQRVPEYNADISECQAEKACPIKAAKVENGKLVIDKEKCNNCGRCIGKCTFNAIESGRTGYKVYIGGRWGKKVTQGRKIEKIFTSEAEALSVVEKAILLFREQGHTGERFADTIERLGFENVQSQLLSDDILKRKDDIIEAKLHLVGGATC